MAKQTQSAPSCNKPSASSTTHTRCAPIRLLHAILCTKRRSTLSFAEARDADAMICIASAKSAELRGGDCAEQGCERSAGCRIRGRAFAAAGAAVRYSGGAHSTSSMVIATPSLTQHLGFRCSCPWLATALHSCTALRSTPAHMQHGVRLCSIKHTEKGYNRHTRSCTLRSSTRCAGRLPGRLPAGREPQHSSANRAAALAPISTAWERSALAHACMAPAQRRARWQRCNDRGRTGASGP